MSELRVIPIQRDDLTVAADADDLDISLDGTTTHVELINLSDFDLLYSFDEGTNWDRLKAQLSRDNTSPGSPNSQMVATGGATNLRIRGLFNIRNLQVDTSLPTKLQPNVIPQTIIVSELAT